MGDKVVQIGDVKNRLAEEALRRYKFNIDRGMDPQEARNIAVSQTAKALQMRYSADTVRRELSRLLDPAPGPRWADPPPTNPRPPSGPTTHWRLP